MPQYKEEPLKKLGTLIRSAREQRGMTLFDLSNEARVSIEHIKSIEIGARKTLPEDTYLLGYLIKLLKALNFDNADKLVEQYKKEEGHHIVENIVNSYEPNEVNRGLQLSDFKIYHLYVIFTLALFIIAWFTVMRGTENFLPSGIGEVIKPGHILEPMEKKYDLDIMAENGTDANGKPLNVLGDGAKIIEIEVTEPVWYQIIGVKQKKVLYEGYISKSEAPKRFKFMDDQGFVISTGNAAAIIAKTGNTASRIGLRGENIRWFYPPELANGSPATDSTDNGLGANTNITNQITNTKNNGVLSTSGLQEQQLVRLTQTPSSTTTTTVNTVPVKPKVAEPTIHANLGPNPFVKKVIPAQQIRTNSELKSKEQNKKEEKRGWFGRKKKDKKKDKSQD